MEKLGTIRSSLVIASICVTLKKQFAMSYQLHRLYDYYESLLRSNSCYVAGQSAILRSSTWRTKTPAASALVITQVLNRAEGPTHPLPVVIATGKQFEISQALKGRHTDCCVGPPGLGGSHTHWPGPNGTRQRMCRAFSPVTLPICVSAVVR